MTGSEQCTSGQDRDAYVAGERAAMARALQMLLPSQQAIGVLSSGLQRLEARVQEEAAHSRQAHLVTADARSVIQVVNRVSLFCHNALHLLDTDTYTKRKVTLTIFMHSLLWILWINPFVVHDARDTSARVCP